MNTNEVDILKKLAASAGAAPARGVNVTGRVMADIAGFQPEGGNAVLAVSAVASLVVAGAVAFMALSSPSVGSDPFTNMMSLLAVVG
jgi:hypothetical protein